MKTNDSVSLKNLHGKKINGYKLYLGDVKQLHLSGWKGFQLFLQDWQGTLSTSPAIKGIYSVGGKDGVKPWMDVEYFEELQFIQKEKLKQTVFLSSKGLDTRLFQLLGEMIPPGGHLMVSYEGEDRIHKDTMKSLNLGIPPAATPLGFLIFMGGFQYIKNWYLAEGGHEGPRKLWGEKAPDESWVQNFYIRTAQQILQFLEKESDSAYKELEKRTKKRSKEIFEIIKKHYKGNLRLD